MVRTKDQAGAFACEKVPHRFNLVRRRFLLGDHMVQAEHHHGVRVRENPFIDRQPLSCLIDPLINGHRLSGDLADQVWKLTSDK